MNTVTTWFPGLLVTGPDLTPAIAKAITAALTPGQTMALTMYAEARSRLEPGRGWVPNPLDAMVDVLEVIDYRAQRPRWRDVGHKGVCLHPAAFSCWMKSGGLRNGQELLETAQRLAAGELPNPRIANCLAAAEGCLAGALVHTLPADTCHYYAEWMPQPPAWSFHDPETRQQPRTPAATRFGHLFFAGVP